MGRELAASSPVFAARLAECATALDPYVDWSLKEVLAQAPGAPGLDTAAVAQPALWAVMVSLAAVWEAAGITPDAVIGHSQGEIAAACVAGILTLEDAARVVAIRGRALTGLGATGGMLSVVMPEPAVRELVDRADGRLSIAAVNGPGATVVSGEPDALAELGAELAKRRVLRWPVPATADFVAHSPKVGELAETLTGELAAIRPLTGRVPLYSTALCRWMDGTELDAGYWYTNVRETVRFDEAVRALGAAGYRTYIEVSPQPVLTTAIAETLQATVQENQLAADPVITGTLTREQAGPRQLLAALALLHVSGASVNWPAVLPAGRALNLPTYAFQRRRYWPQPALPAVAVAGDSTGGVAESLFWAAVDSGDAAGIATALDLDEQRPFSEALSALASWRRRTRDRSAVAGWRYRVSWVPVADPVPALLSGTWLALVPAGLPDADPAGDLARQSVRALAERGARVVVAETAAGQDRQALAAAIRQGLSADGAIDDTGPVAGVLSLLALDETPTLGSPVLTAGLAGTLTLLQALEDAGIAAPLWVVTSGAVAAAPGEVLTSPVQAQAWGLGLVAGLEHPGRWGGLLDLPPVVKGAALDERAVFDQRMGARLCTVLAGCGEDQVAIRTAGIFARRLTRAPQSAESERHWAPRGSVLVTGGTEAVGGHVARWLAGRGAPRLVLASGSGPEAPGAAVLAESLAARGTRVDLVTCDVAQRADVAGLLARTAADGPPLSAVLHAEGSGRMAASAFWLDELTADLDEFVLFSSATASVGGPRQAGDAAQSAFLAALAERRLARGLPATSVAWGPWDGDRPGDGSDGPREPWHWLRPLDPELAVSALGQVLDGGEGPVTIADVDWAELTALLAPRGSSPLIAGLPEVRQALAVSALPATAQVPQAAGLRERLARSSGADQERLLSDLVRSQAALILGHESPEEVEMELGFLELGFDSLTATKFLNQLNAVTGLRLPASALSEWPTLAAFARRLRAELAAPGLGAGHDGGGSVGGGTERPDGGHRYVAAGDADGDDPDIVADALPAHSLTALFVRAAREHRATEITPLIQGLAGFRPTFAGPAELANVPGPVPVSRGAATPGLFCFPSFLGRSSPQEYARFAREFRGLRELSVLPAPGFASGEPLPADLRALVSVHGENIRRSAGGAPFVVVGHSSGGMVAHAVAAHLDESGTAPAAVVIIDTPSPVTGDPEGSEVARRHAAALSGDHWSVFLAAALAKMELSVAAEDDAWITAMVYYFSLGWATLSETSVPTLLVRASEPMGGNPEDGEWQATWALSTNVTMVDVPGNHFTMMGDHAGSTAQAVNQWLAGL
jgi:malonyl CoA-acyl carrier protein transacylase